MPDYLTKRFLKASDEDTIEQAWKRCTSPDALLIVLRHNLDIEETKKIIVELLSYVSEFVFHVDSDRAAKFKREKQIDAVAFGDDRFSSTQRDSGYYLDHKGAYPFDMALLDAAVFLSDVRAPGKIDARKLTDAIADAYSEVAAESEATKGPEREYALKMIGKFLKERVRVVNEQFVVVRVNPSSRRRANPMTPQATAVAKYLIALLKFPVKKATVLLRVMEALDLESEDVAQAWKRKPRSWVDALRLLDEATHRRTGSIADIFEGANDVDQFVTKLSKQVEKIGVKGDHQYLFGRHQATALAAFLGDGDAMRAIVEIVANSEAHADIMDQTFATDEEVLAALDAKVDQYIAKYDQNPYKGKY